MEGMTEEKKNSIKNVPLYNLSGIEIFSSGKWNGDQYTDEDLDIMVEAFQETRDQIKPFAKLGHDNGQFMAQQDGHPAVGWITNLYRSGNKLIADIKDIPEKVYQLILNKAYKRVSSEIFWNLKLGDKVYKRVLAAIAFLGGDTPAVTTLDDILGLYGLNSNAVVKYNSNYDLKVYNLMEDKKMENELQEKLVNAENELKNYSQKLEEKEKETLKLQEDYELVKKEMSALAAEKEKLIQENIEVAREKFLDKMQAEKLITPALREYAKSMTEKIENEVIEKFLKLAKETFSSVNFDENSKNNENASKDEETLINEYMQANKCDYRAAYRAIVKK